MLAYSYRTDSCSKLKSQNGNPFKRSYLGFSHHKCTVHIMRLIFKAQVDTLTISLDTCIAKMMQLYSDYLTEVVWLVTARNLILSSFISSALHLSHFIFASSGRGSSESRLRLHSSCKIAFHCNRRGQQII